MKVCGMFFFSQDLLIEQRIQTFLSDHAKAHGQLYLPDDRRIYFHYFKGWKEWFLLRGNLLLPILFVFMRNETAYIRFGTFYVNRIKKIWIEEEEWHMRIILTTSHIATSFVIGAASIFNKMIVLLPCEKHRLFNFTLCYWMPQEGMVWSSIGYPNENIANRFVDVRARFVRFFSPPLYANRDIDHIYIEK